MTIVGIGSATNSMSIKQFSSPDLKDQILKEVLNQTAGRDETAQNRLLRNEPSVSAA